MNETSLSLIDRLRDSPDSESWDRLVRLYSPLIRNWMRKFEIQDSDADDLLQDVLIAVSKDVARFEHSGRTGAFRSWLRSILVNRLRNFWRSRGRRPVAPGSSSFDQKLSQLDDPASALTLLWNQEHDQHVLRELLEIVKSNFTEETWNAFTKVALEGQRADVVASELNISLNSVFIAKSRVLSRLRQEAEGIVESSSSFFCSD
ncbi:MAG: sigma-70 family RNA polymerase sigma factor [Planctomycetaceae bacterium]|nr:sigma-70 family RNA polymerase sigma factor [Planctomycetaceae bacterium]